jgi:hypothetical protein
MAATERLGIAIEAAIARWDAKSLGDLLDQRNQLGDYGAMMALDGKQRPMMLHPQTICDLATVINLGETIFEELKSAPR